MVSETSKNSLVTYTTAAAIGLMAIHCLGYFNPSGLAWGFNYFSFLPPYFLIAYLALGIPTIVFLRSISADKLFQNLVLLFEHRSWLFLALVCVVFMGAVFFFQVRLPLLGDSFIIIKNYDNEFFGEKALWMFRSPMAVYYFSMIMKLFGWTQYPEMLSAFLYGELLLGIGFILCSFLMVKNLFTEAGTQLVSFLFLVCMPYIQIFLGYVEVYAVLLFAISLFFLTVSLYLNKRIHLVFVGAAFIYMLLAHMMMASLGLVMAYLFYLEYCSRGVRTVLLTAFLLAIICFLLFAGAGFDMRHFISLTPHSNFLTLSDTKAPFQAYSLFSGFHASEILNALLLTSFFPFFFLLYALFTSGKQALKDSRGVIAIVAIVPQLLFLLVAKFDLGMAKDWDIVASLSVVFAVSATILITMQNTYSSLKSLNIATVVIVLSIVPWFFLNSTVNENINRTESFLDRRVVSPEGYYLATLHLASHYINTGDMTNTTRIFERYLHEFPDDLRIYELLTRTLIESGNKKNPKIEELYRRWVARSPDDTLARQNYAAYIMEQGTIFYNEHNVDSAKAKYQHALTLNQHAYVAYNNLGLMYLQQLEFELAVAYFDTAITVNPAYTTAYINLANTYNQMNKLDSAISILQTVIQMEKANISAYENLSKAYYRNGDKEKAVATLKKAAQLGSPTAQYLLRTSGESWE